MARTKRQRPATSPVALSELMQREMSRVARDLRKRNALDGEVVHVAHKALKRARAALRLLRDAAGKSFYIRENAQLRDAARPLGRLRDTQALRKKLDGLLKGEENGECRSVLMKLRRELNGGWRKLHEEAQRAGTLKKSALMIEEVTGRMGRQRLRVSEPSFVQTGIARIYRKGRVALADAVADQSDDNLHESRKQAKYIVEAMKIVAPGAHGGLANIINRADAVADSLGDDHDLVLLQEKTAALRVPSTAAHESMLTRIAHKRKKLQKKALKRARRLYRKKPGSFIKKLQSEP